MADENVTYQRRKLVSLPFHERFNIPMGLEQAQKRFVNRAFNYVFENSMVVHFDHDVDELRRTAVFQVANAFGEKWKRYADYDYYVQDDFYRCLRALEVSYGVLTPNAKAELTGTINLWLLDESEVDLGISWQPPAFVPTGAQLLDESLVNESLRWLSEPKYITVYDPFEKALKHFVESEKKPHLLADVITDMYEALEALAKIITGRANKNLSANRAKFISEARVSEHYKKLLKEYISYANEFRHAAKEPGTKPVPSKAEVESFIYLTGLFIRLAIQRT